MRVEDSYSLGLVWIHQSTLARIGEVLLPWFSALRSLMGIGRGSPATAYRSACPAKETLENQVPGQA